MSQEEKDKLLSTDLGRGYYRMSQAKIIALVGCTITGCLTVFGGILYIDRELTTHTLQINQNTEQIRDLRDNQSRFWTKVTNIDLQLQEHIQNDQNNNPKSR